MLNENRSNLYLVYFVLLLTILWQPFCLAQEDQETEVDPWEGFNRVTFKINDSLDTYLLRPITVGYTKVTPQAVQSGIYHVLNNLAEIKNVVNNLLQANFADAGKDTSRFMINSTFGVFGLFDVASKMDIERSNQDFGITLAKWGVKSGNYVVLPFFGPSTVRDGISLIPDSGLSVINYLHPAKDRYYAYILNALDSRSQFLEAEKIITGDKYIFMRTIYLQNRAYKIDGEIEDDF